MPSFFIDRPIFAWVVALFICLIGAISIPLLAVAQYPIIAPPSISISTSYPGASPENLYNSVTRLIEEELNGASGILNFESTSDSLGQVEIIANFVPGTETGDNGNDRRKARHRAGNCQQADEAGGDTPRRRAFHASRSRHDAAGLLHSCHRVVMPRQRRSKADERWH